MFLIIFNLFCSTYLFFNEKMKIFDIFQGCQIHLVGTPQSIKLIQSQTSENVFVVILPKEKVSWYTCSDFNANYE